MKNKKEDPLTESERDIVLSLVDGQTIYQISDRRGTTYNTLSTQLAMLRLRFQCSNTVQLVGKLFREKIIE